jgi:hypothetical protein
MFCVDRTSQGSRWSGVRSDVMHLQQGLSHAAKVWEHVRPSSALFPASLGVFPIRRKALSIAHAMPRVSAHVCPCLPMSTLARTALNLRKNESTDSLWPSPHPGLWNSIHCSRRDTRLLRLRPAIVVVPPKLRVRESSQMISLDALPRPLRVPATRPSHHHRPSITPARVLSAASRLTASYIDALAFRVHCRPWAARDSLDYSG